MDAPRTMRTPPVSRGKELDTSPECFGELAPYQGDRNSQIELENHFERHGYLYIPAFFERSTVETVRLEICEQLEQRGLLDSNADPGECVPNPVQSLALDKSKGSASYEDVIPACPSYHELMYGDKVSKFFETLLGGKPRHYDFTWFRAVAPGMGTVPHCDVVYMGRGTHELYTVWTPMGDISMQMGGLMVLEGSSNLDVQSRLANYVTRDVDEYCANRPLPGHVDFDSTTDNKVWNGWLAQNPVTLRNNLGGRWLTTEYSMGDVLIFSVHLVHASLDNQSTRFRLSTDARYQRADQPIDDRFIGEGPFGHVGSAKRGRVC